MFLEYWKRTNNTLNYTWGTTDYKEREVERPSFTGKLEQGVYYKGSWIPFEDGVAEKFEFELPPKRKYYPNKVRRSKVAAAFPLISTMIVSVVVASFAVLSLRLFVQRSSSYGGSIAGAALNAVTIIIMNILWKTVARKLTEWENYRTESEFDNNLIFKIFTFYFVNSYTSLYYIAFFKNKTSLFANGAIEDGCKTRFNNNMDDVSEVISKGCADEVTFQLITILLVNMFIGQSQEVAIPWLIGRLKQYIAARNGVVPKELPAWERDSKKNNYAGTLDEYSELVIQYGYLTIFAATAPFACLLAVINNMVEIRTDAFKLLTGCCRPNYRGAQNIGTWYAILELLGVVAVFTNCALIGLSFEVLYASVSGYGTPEFFTLAIVVIMEHFIFILKYVIAFLVPDYPGWIIKKLAFEEWLKQEAFKAARKKTHRNTVWESGNHGDDEVDDDTPAQAPSSLETNDVTLVIAGPL